MPKRYVENNYKTGLIERSKKKRIAKRALYGTFGGFLYEVDRYKESVGRGGGGGVNCEGGGRAGRQ